MVDMAIALVIAAIAFRMLFAFSARFRAQCLR